MPLGIIDSTLFARDPAKYGSSKKRNAKPIEGKESNRWLIEVFHKVLKSGCEIEERQIETAERLATRAALDRVGAWRILLLTVQSRESQRGTHLSSKWRGASPS